ncbi:MAG: hypothetical protein EOP48_33475 [Sphingobacteriales bacterium]|nr:MAG: hypothetical protein EOP48_33475 [Sphingobacteriales bacterium]
MLPLFEELTKELNEHERKVLVPMLIDTLHGKHIGNKITCGQIVDWFKACGEKTRPERVRTMIKYIRVLRLKQGVTFNIEGSVIMGMSQGYYLTSDLEEVEKQAESMRGRVRSGQAVVHALEEELLEMKSKRA